MAERPRVLLSLPSRGDGRIEATRSHYALATRGACDVMFTYRTTSLLAYGFNCMWATALNMARAGAVTHWLLHHDDIECRTHGWLDVMVEEMRSKGAAVLSVVQAIKDHSELTSTAMGDLADPWLARKFSLGDIFKLPETFCAADTRWPSRPLLVNTGLMLVDLSRPEWQRKNADGSLKFRFQVSDRIVEVNDDLEAQVRPEDWAFSRDCFDAGLPVYATRKVECHHWGVQAWSNQIAAPTAPEKPAATVEATEHYYQGIEGWFDFPDVYREAIRRTPEGGAIVEVGCWRGKSLAFLLVEAKLSGKIINIFGVDHFQGSVAQPTLLVEANAEDLHAQACRNAARAGYSHWCIHKRESADAARMFPDGSLDFVFIDASHNYTAVLTDIETWLPKVKPGGVLAGHDHDEYGVAQAVEASLPAAEKRGRCWWYEVPKVKEPVHAEAAH